MSACRPRPAPSRATLIPSRSSKFAGRKRTCGRDCRIRLAHSFLEADTHEYLLHRDDVLDVVEQPPAVTYVGDDAKVHRHTFDAIAIMRDGKRVAIVIKPHARAERLQTGRLVQLLASQVPAQVADAVALVTERDIDPDVLHDAQLVSKALLHPRHEHDEVLTRYIAAHPRPATVTELCAATGLGGDGFRAIARLVGRGVLKRISSGRIDADAVMVAASKTGGVTA